MQKFEQDIFYIDTKFLKVGKRVWNRRKDGTNLYIIQILDYPFDGSNYIESVVKIIYHCLWCIRMLIFRPYIHFRIWRIKTKIKTLKNENNNRK